MAIFYGTLLGKSGSVASRQGSRKSGLTATLSSWDGVLGLSLYWDQLRSRNSVLLTAGRGGGLLHTIYDGPVVDLARGLYLARRVAELRPCTEAIRTSQSNQELGG